MSIKLNSLYFWISKWRWDCPRTGWTITCSL